ncbi:MAG TPA: alginate lyase family protein [Gemmatimonadales bacterium]|nr:alginate lyase family protein [Gemmatimonadales bacterium]
MNTIRHLKPIQVYGRVLYRLRDPRPDLRAAPPLRPTSPGEFVAGAERSASMVGPLAFRFLNETRSLAEHGWDDPAVAKLWRYNLHYFDDLNACNADRRSDWHREVLERWVQDNPPARGTGWEAYPASLRIVNWIKWALRGNRLPDESVASLAVQVRWLSKRLETHLLGNHLFANAKALVYAGLYFDGPEATDWLDRGMSILADQVPVQILPDGAHFELSPMYHALALEDVLDLCNAATAFADGIPAPWQPAVGRLRSVIGPMRDWLATMCHPDGEIGFFNDAAIGIAPSPGQLEAYAKRLGFPALGTARSPITRLGASGYIRIEQGPAVAMLDVGLIGPDYLPAHAHADTLSFELSLFGQRVLVNSGTSLYAAGAERLRQRSTAAHNTVLVDHADSSEVWSAFRVARRARPVGLKVDEGGAPQICCAHDGYRRMPGRPTHRRAWRFEPGALSVIDRIDGRFQTAQARFHLHPTVIASPPSDGGIGLELCGGRRARLRAEGGTLRVEDSTWHPEFGLRVPTRCVVADFEGPNLCTTLSWDAT